MATQEDVEVRPLKVKDISSIADYWLKSEPDFLIKMGVDLNKMPTRDEMESMLLKQIHTPDPQKNSLALILEINGTPSGHCNVNNITYGQEATLHLHIWNQVLRQKGLGTTMVLKSLPVFFERLLLKTFGVSRMPTILHPAGHLKKSGLNMFKNTLPLLVPSIMSRK